MGEIFQSAVATASGVVAEAGETKPTSRSKVRVWLVDDNDELRKLIAEVLGHQGGIDCAHHFSSPEALLSALASKPGPDVILLDVQMGKHCGLDAVRPIKSLTRSTRVLMFTTCHNPEWRARALGDGASDYLLKSEPMENVAARIRCPANDPTPGSYPRRRASRLTERTVPTHVARPFTNKPAHLFSRTLGILRGWCAERIPLG